MDLRSIANKWIVELLQTRLDRGCKPGGSPTYTGIRSEGIRKGGFNLKMKDDWVLGGQGEFFFVDQRQLKNKSSTNSRILQAIPQKNAENE